MKFFSIWNSCICITCFIIHGYCLFCHTGSKLVEINDLFIESHNYYRRIHNVPPFIWDEKLMNDSVQWCRILAKNNRMQLSHSGGNYGENLWKYEGSDIFNIRDMDPVKNWYEEVEAYSFENGENRAETAHFTQLVWKSSRLLGCGVCSNEKIVYVTCRYAPAGNVAGEFLQNVITASGFGKAGTLPIFDVFFGLLVIIFSAAALASLIVYVLKTYWMKKLEEVQEEHDETEEETIQEEEEN